uniref:Uncharacterized protein n=1 Tax=Arundo donax TaxID=35708 RepID=A0A0A9EX29_ARUDO
MHQIEPSCAMVLRVISTLGVVPLKTQSHLCFQISQAVRVTRELSHFCSSFGTCFAALHQQLEKRPLLRVGANCPKST